MTRARRSGRTDGYILVAVLGVMLLLTAFMAAGSLLVRSALESARIGDDDVAMLGLARGGLELTAYQLFTRKVPAGSVSGRRVKFAGGVIAPAITDEGGKVDLNASDPKLLQAVIESTGMDAGTARGIVDRIVLLRGADRNKSANAPPGPGGQPVNLPPNLPGAAQPAGSGQGGGQAGDNHPRGFQSLDQLRDFPDFQIGDLRALAHRLTVFNPDGKVNILTAGPAVLAALPGLTRPKVEEILARRGNPTKDVVASLQSMLGEASNYAKIEGGPAYDVEITATSSLGRKKVIDAVIAASKSPTDPYYILDWRE